MADIIKIALAIAALYSAGSWLMMFRSAYRGRVALQNDESLRREVQAVTFHLGLCFILATGFLGMLVK